MTGPKSINCAIWHQTTLSGGCISGSLGGCVRMMSFLSRRAKPMKWVTCDSIRSGYRCIRGNKSARAMSLIWAIVLDGWMDWMDWTRGNFQYRDVLHGGLLECPVASKNGYVGPKTVIQEKHFDIFSIYEASADTWHTLSTFMTCTSGPCRITPESWGFNLQHLFPFFGYAYF